MTQIDGETGEVVFLKLFGNETLYRSRQDQFAELCLDSYFPSAGGAEIYNIFAVLNNTANRGGQPIVVKYPPQEGMCVQQRLHATLLTFEAFQDLFREWLKERVWNRYPALGTPRFSLIYSVSNWHQTCHRYPGFGNYDLLSGQYPIEKFGKMGFGLMYVDFNRHMSVPLATVPTAQLL